MLAPMSFPSLIAWPRDYMCRGGKHFVPACTALLADGRCAHISLSLDPVTDTRHACVRSARARRCAPRRWRTATGSTWARASRPTWLARSARRWGAPPNRCAARASIFGRKCMTNDVSICTNVSCRGRTECTVHRPAGCTVHRPAGWLCSMCKVWAVSWLNASA